MSINKHDSSLDSEDVSYVDSNGSHHKSDSIEAKNFEIFNKKRLIFDIKEKETSISNLVEAIQFCHEKHSSSGVNHSLVNFSQMNDYMSHTTGKSGVKNMSSNQKDVTVLNFLESLCIDVKVQKHLH